MKNPDPRAREKDIQIFEEILSMIPEDIMRDFSDCLNYDAIYRQGHAKILNILIEKTKNIRWSFFNTQVQDYFENLKEARDNLDSFLQDHFFVKGPIFMLYPEKIKTQFWKGKRKELAPLTEAFMQKYNTFVKYGHLILYKNESIKISRRTPPKSRTKGKVVYMVIGKEEIRIAKEETRQSKLWKALINPFGIPRAIDWVFGHIESSRDRDNKSLLYGHTRTQEQKKILRNTIKELQKILKTHGLEIIKFNIKDGKIWMEWAEKNKN